MVAFNNPIPQKPRFELGHVVATPAELENLARAGQEAKEFLNRHQKCDWGSVCDEDRQANEQALIDDGRLMSVYMLSNSEQIWVITEADRSSTCVLTPDDY